MMTMIMIGYLCNNSHAEQSVRFFTAISPGGGGGAGAGGTEADNAAPACSSE